MPGMTKHLQAANPTMISAFHTALLHQLLVVALVAVVLAVAWNLLRTLQYRRATSAGRAPMALGAAAAGDPEPLGRHMLRIGFGLTWILDGLLQAQAGMVVGMPTTVMRPAATGSPAWVHSLVNVGVTIWANHPVQAAASAVWIQLGIGVLLLVAPRGRWSQVAGLVSIGWALVVWVFGEALGAIFAPGLSWATGAPGGVVFYAVAGGLIALPEWMWLGRRLARLVVAGMGVFFLGMALLQAWPGRGFWHGRIGHAQGKLAAMVSAMAKTPQPALFSGWVSSFAAFDTAHGWAVNLFLVVALAAIGVGLLTGRRRPVVVATAAAAVVCLATWVLVEDFGFFGGMGTDPNSMIPMLLIVGAGVVALVRRPVEATEPAAVYSEVPMGAGVSGGRWWEGLTPGYTGRVLAAVAAIVVVLVGAVPMASASTNPQASPIITESTDGTPDLINYPAPPFTLTDQDGAKVSLASLRGKIVALTFLDPVCTADCPLIAQEFRQADTMLGSQAARTVFVAIVANPIYHSVADTQAFDRQEGFTHVSNWLYLTGSVSQLQQVWKDYGIMVEVTPAGSMVAHGELAYVIDEKGHERSLLDAVPGTSSASYSSFSALLSDQIHSVLST